MILNVPELCPNGFCLPVDAPADSPVTVPVLEGDQDWGGRVELVPDNWPRKLLGGRLDFHGNYADVHLGFQDEVQPILFSGLKLGADILHEGITLSARQYPPPGVAYISTEPSQPWIDVIRFEYDPNEEYEVVVWAEEQGRRYETRWIFKTPIPPSPYPSWTWNDTTKLWEAPVKKPELNSDDNYFLIWNESIMDWEQEPDYILDDSIR